MKHIGNPNLGPTLRPDPESLESRSGLLLPLPGFVKANVVDIHGTRVN